MLIMNDDHHSLVTAMLGSRDGATGAVADGGAKHVGRASPTALAESKAVAMLRVLGGSWLEGWL